MASHIYTQGWFPIWHQSFLVITKRQRRTLQEQVCTNGEDWRSEKPKKFYGKSLYWNTKHLLQQNTTHIMTLDGSWHQLRRHFEKEYTKDLHIRCGEHNKTLCMLLTSWTGSRLAHDCLLEINQTHNIKKKKVMSCRDVHTCTSGFLFCVKLIVGVSSIYDRPCV